MSLLLLHSGPKNLNILDDEGGFYQGDKTIAPAPSKAWSEKGTVHLTAATVTDEFYV
jgi:hypothetical protein